MKIENMVAGRLNLLLFLAITMLSCARKNNIEIQSNSSPLLRQITSPCEDCELMLIGIPHHLNSVDTTEGWNEAGQKLIVKGKILQPDRKSNASDIVLYYYHTDQQGYYSPGEKSNAGTARHGRLRGWVKTGSDGTFSIFTNRPAQYPGNAAEAHIHVIIKEPDMDKPYWTDAWVFDDDPLLTTQIRNRLENRGGSGILKTTSTEDIQITYVTIVLGLNIPGYPHHK